MIHTQIRTSLKSLGITALLNTIAALVIRYIIMKNHPFLDVLIISQIIGLSTASFVMSGSWLAEKKELPIFLGIVIGMSLGIFSGCLLSWGFLSVFRNVDSSYFLKYIVSNVIILGFVFGIPIIYFFNSRRKLTESENKIQLEKIKRLSIEKEAAMTSLKLLQAQIEPHFLFNTLSNVISLFDIDTKAAKKMLINFNEYLRTCLQRTRQETITLTEELHLIRQYLEIFKIRMGDRLTYEINNLTDEPQIYFPPLIIQPLVENSIKYGIEPKIDGGHIDITCRTNDQKLEIIIRDTGTGLDNNANQAGIGINNVSQRLEHIYGNVASIAIKQNHPNGVTATIKIPL